jgi:tol-pal system protein YbgF
MKRWLMISLPLLLLSCATTEETLDLRMRIDSLEREMEVWRQESQRKMAKNEKDLRGLLKETDTSLRGLLNEEVQGLRRDMEGMRKAMAELSLSVQGNEERLKELMGKTEELRFQLEAYRKDVDVSIKALKDAQRGLEERLKAATTKREAETTAGYESAYGEAFQAFQRGSYDEAVERFSKFLKDFPTCPLLPNALFWKAEAHMKRREYERAIATFQDLLERYPKSDLAPQAMLSQSEAFFRLSDKKGCRAILERLIELFPESEEARLARLRLRSLD